MSEQPTPVTVGLAEAICARPGMEDRHAVSAAPDGVTIVAVFDGHGGSRVAEAAAGRVVDVVASSVKRDPCFQGNAWAQIFAALDAPAPAVGSTATVLCLVPPMLHVAHVGDSRALLVRPAAHLRLTADHREETPSERIFRQRILPILRSPDASLDRRRYEYYRLPEYVSSIEDSRSIFVKEF